MTAEERAKDVDELGQAAEQELLNQVQPTLTEDKAARLLGFGVNTPLNAVQVVFRVQRAEIIPKRSKPKSYSKQRDRSLNKPPFKNVILPLRNCALSVI